MEQAARFLPRLHLNLAKGRDLETSVRYAKNYISRALAAMLDLGKGSGPMNHAFAVEGEYKG
mgnify:CR=1 FL=1